MNDLDRSALRFLKNQSAASKRAVGWCRSNVELLEALQDIEQLTYISAEMRGESKDALLYIRKKAKQAIAKSERKNNA